MRTHKFLIGISGKARSGKDTVANMIKDIFLSSEEDVLIKRFSQPIKDMLRIGFNLTEEEIEGDLKDKKLHDYGVSPRQMMQTLGTEWGRELHSDIWVINLMRAIENIPEKIIIIPDVRFLNELKLIRNSGILIHINRENTEGVNPHVSEAGIATKEGDYIINNNGTLEDLKGMVKLVERKLYGKAVKTVRHM